MAKSMTKTNTSSKATTIEKKEIEEVKRTYSLTDEIPCRSVCAGELLMVGKKSNSLYIWSDIGDIQYVQVADLQALPARSDYLMKPYFLIDDEEFLDSNRRWESVKTVYSEYFASDDLSELLLTSTSVLKSALESLPNGIRRTLAIVARDMIESGRLDSIKSIKIIDEVLGTDLMTCIVE